MTSTRKTFSIFVVIGLMIHGGHSGDSPSMQNRYLAHLFHKYGSHGTISFEGFEHLMHNLGLGGLEFPAKHTLDEHRPSGYKVHDFHTADTSYTAVPGESRSDDIDRATDESVDQTTTDAATTSNTNEATTVYEAEKDYNIIKLMNVFDNDKQEDIFRTMHDPFHRHPRHRDQGQSSSSAGNTCLSPITLIELYMPGPANKTQQYPIYRSTREARTVVDSDDDGKHQSHPVNDDEHFNSDIGQKTTNFNVANVQITPDTFMNLCPALLVQIEQGSCSERYNQRSEADPIIQPTEGKENQHIAWISAVVSVTIISLCGLVGVAMVPLTKFGAYHEILRFLVAVAIGTLCGDALMHLLPHALVPHDDDKVEAHGDVHSHEEKEREAVWICGCAFVAAVIMYGIETLLPLVGGGHGHSHGHDHRDDHTTPTKPEPQNDTCQVVAIDRNCGSCEDIENDLEISKKNIEENVMVKDTTNVVRPWLTPVAFMVIIGDGLHNLTDGMAIGAAFGVDPVTGMATALAVLCHELPHELGDFALLLQTGVSLRRAIMLNIVSSVLSFIGMVIGLLIVNVNADFVRWIYAGTAGTFLYIAFADLVPELGRTKVTGKVLLVQVFGIVLGGIIMLLIALYEDSLKELFDGD